MEKVVKTKTNLVPYEVDENKIFLWKLKNREDLEDNKSILTFEREDYPFTKDLTVLEKKFHKSSIIPMWLLIVLSTLSIGMYSAFLIVFLINKNSMDIADLFFPMLLPAIIFTVAVGVIGLIKTKQTQKYIANSENRYKEYKNKVQELLINNGYTIEQ